jgi:hypothetical protein
MAARQLILTCSLSGSRDCAAVQLLLEQYGLVAANLDGELVAQGWVPIVLERMHQFDIASHLAQRIEDAVPGTRVADIRATVLRHEDQD